MMKILKAFLVGAIVLGSLAQEVWAESDGAMTDQDFERLAQEMTAAVDSQPEPAPNEKMNELREDQRVNELREDQIPVLATQSESSPVKGAQSHRLLWSFGIVVIAGLAIVMATRYWSKRRPGLKVHNQIKVLTQYSLGPKKSLAIVRVAGESILIGVTDHSISMLKSLSLLDEDLPEDVPPSFGSELTEQELGGDLSEDQFYVSKLKSMRPS